jgi:hypothetical protein
VADVARGRVGKPNASRKNMELTSEKLQRAIAWVNERRRAHFDLPTKPLLEDAARRFDLDLKEEHHLRHIFHA